VFFYPQNPPTQNALEGPKTMQINQTWFLDPDFRVLSRRPTGHLGVYPRAWGRQTQASSPELTLAMQQLRLSRDDKK
jgi:hypothetical protein